MIIHPDGRLEGTPEELMQYKEAQAKKQLEDWQKKINGPWNHLTNPVIGKAGCPTSGPCFCTGACIGKGATGNPEAWKQGIIYQSMLTITENETNK